MKRRVRVILRFKDHKLRYQVMANRKKLMEKKSKLKELHFEESLFLSNNMRTENHNIFYKCSQLKNAKRIHTCWFFNNAMNVQLMDKGPTFKACVGHFLSNFYFSPIYSPSKTMKNVFYFI